ncbi:hypothetical protein ABI59_22720 [Acidobacteria bacterium Mor1]|nr:hypothetical protein ABI59_22720 [Acidobacteria bacterium Mor1]
MRWRGRRTSSNVEDRRGMRGGGGMRMGGRPAGVGCGGLVIALLAAYFLGVDPAAVLQIVSGLEQGGQVAAPQREVSTSTPNDELGQFAATVLADTEDTWNRVFAERGRRYQEPRLVLFSGAVASACGYNSAAVGPFYCPADSKVYLDLSFFDQLERRFGAPGDFAQAYVIAHEVGHHIQNQLGISEHVHRQRQMVSKAQGNQLSVKQELQADCLAGVWAYHAQRDRNLLEPGDLEEGLRAASAIGDDTLQKKAQGYTVPESWTHGSSEQRMTWFARGFQSGDIDVCDTFN